jgi:hypothetical protein
LRIDGNGFGDFVITKERDFPQKKKMKFEKLPVEHFYQPAQFPYQNVNLLREWNFFFFFFFMKRLNREWD